MGLLGETPDLKTVITKKEEFPFFQLFHIGKKIYPSVSGKGSSIDGPPLNCGTCLGTGLTFRGIR